MAIFVVSASMVAVGVLTTSGYTMVLVGSNEYMLALWVVGGIIAIRGALTLAELSAALPHTGGDYVYLYHAFGPLAAFLSGWVSFLIGFSGPGAAAGCVSAKFILAPLGFEGNNVILIERSLATVGIVLFALIPLSQRDRTTQVQSWITGLKVLIPCMPIVAGIAIGGRIMPT
ncbi:MAG: amino acid permease [Isosphaeraceae bacterium]